MTTTPPPPPAPPVDAPAGPPPGDEGPRVTRDELRDLGRIRRTTGPDRKLAGVGGGLARHLDVDPVLVRVALVVAVFFGGAGILLYAAGWLLLPEDGTERAALHLDDRNRAFALIGVGALAGIALLADSVGQWGAPWPLVGIALIALVVLTVIDRDKAAPVTAPPVPHAPDPVTGQPVPAGPGVPVVAPPAFHRPPRNPRKRGPVLFWFTLVLAALGVGVLGTLDLAGVGVHDPAYPAVVVAACGVMLLVGAFWGRAGGIILVGLLASVALAGATAAGEIDGSDIQRTPTRAVDVDDSLSAGSGQIVLDLRDVTDLQALDGRDIDLDVTFGRVEVIVPDGLGVDVSGRVKGGGQVELFGDHRDGFDVRDTRGHELGRGLPEIDLDVTVGFGEIQVHEGSAR